MTNDGFEIVPRSAVPADQRGGKASALSLALERGDTVFVPGAKSVIAGRYRQPTGYLRRRGFMTHARNGERDGVSGVFLWAERNGTEPVK